MQRLLPPQLCLVLAATAVGLGLALPVAGPSPVAIRLLGVPVLVVALWLTVGGARQFDRVGTNIVTFDDPDQLVTDGRFSWTRNPMYLGMVLLLAGVALLLGTASPWGSVVAFFFVADRWYVPFEERRMAEVFGDDWVRYRARVARWIGRRTVVA